MISDSRLLKEHYSRIIEEYKFSMERKDRVLDWSIGIFFIALVAYVELVRYQLPSIWRICLIVGLLCFVIRLFSSSCLAYAYLKKWRHLLDSIEKYWATEKEALDLVKSEIERYQYTPRTTEGRIYFIKHQLVGGFFLLFLFPLVMLAWEIYSNPQDLRIVVPLLFLIAYFVYESFIFVRNKELSMPPENAAPPASNEADTEGAMNEKERSESRDDRREEIRGIFVLGLLAVLASIRAQYDEMMVTVGQLTFDVIPWINILITLWSFYAFFMVIGLSEDIVGETASNIFRGVSKVFLQFNFLIFGILTLVFGYYAYPTRLPWALGLIAILLIYGGIKKLRTIRKISAELDLKKIIKSQIAPSLLVVFLVCFVTILFYPEEQYVIPSLFVGFLVIGIYLAIKERMSTERT